MNCAVIAFTRRGAALGHRLAEAWGAPLCVPPRLAEELGERAYDSLEAWTAEAWGSREALVFVGACGIAVRAIAPHVRDKFTDPAVIALDEGGSWAIALLSGHVGGANALARQAAALTGGQAVVTTATDVNGLFAVDVWARERNLAIGDRVLAKEVSAAILEGETVGFVSDFPTEGALPKGLTWGPRRLTIRVTDREDREPGVLRLIPGTLILGLGCRRGKSAGELEAAVEEALGKGGLDPRAVGCTASIDLKKDEPGLLEFCRARKLPLRTYSAQALEALPGEFTHSDLVRKVTGVDNVCERAAVLTGGDLVLPKQAGNGVTVAVARKKTTIYL
ncbi:MAG: cobalamin biosynthesis protein [Candidatus Faecousia sp.]|nr:cobalamin biosynthesis protein [Bacillota bacterium]MDY4220738.1 cobalamin biosynthesis protein [Candidatus Faecousia sp.]